MYARLSLVTCWLGQVETRICVQPPNWAQRWEKRTWRSWHVVNGSLESGIRFSETYTELFLKSEQSERNIVKCSDIFSCFRIKDHFCNTLIVKYWKNKLILCNKYLDLLICCVFSNLILDTRWTRRFSILRYSSWKLRVQLWLDTHFWTRSSVRKLDTPEQPSSDSRFWTYSSVR